MDLSFLVVVAVALALVSVMIGARVAATGAGSRKVALMIAEAWVVVAIWIGFFRWLSGAMGPPSESGGFSGLTDLPARFAHLPGAAQVGAVIGLGVCIALIAHLMRSMGRLNGSRAS